MAHLRSFLETQELNEDVGVDSVTSSVEIEASSGKPKKKKRADPKSEKSGRPKPPSRKKSQSSSSSTPLGNGRLDEHLEREVVKEVPGSQSIGTQPTAPLSEADSTTSSLPTPSLQRQSLHDDASSHSRSKTRSRKLTKSHSRRLRVDTSCDSTSEHGDSCSVQSGSQHRARRPNSRDKLAAFTSPRRSGSSHSEHTATRPSSKPLRQRSSDSITKPVRQRSSDNITPSKPIRQRSSDSITQTNSFNASRPKNKQTRQRSSDKIRKRQDKGVPERSKSMGSLKLMSRRPPATPPPVVDNIPTLLTSTHSKKSMGSDEDFDIASFVSSGNYPTSISPDLEEVEDDDVLSIVFGPSSDVVDRLGESCREGRRPSVDSIDILKFHESAPLNYGGDLRNAGHHEPAWLKRERFRQTEPPKTPATRRVRSLHQSMDWDNEDEPLELPIRRPIAEEVGEDLLSLPPAFKAISNHSTRSLDRVGAQTPTSESSERTRSLRELKKKAAAESLRNKIAQMNELRNSERQGTRTTDVKTPSSTTANNGNESLERGTQSLWSHAMETISVGKDNDDAEPDVPKTPKSKTNSEPTPSSGRKKSTKKSKKSKTDGTEASPKVKGSKAEKKPKSVDRLMLPEDDEDDSQRQSVHPSVKDAQDDEAAISKPETPQKLKESNSTNHEEELQDRKLKKSNRMDFEEQLNDSKPKSPMAGLKKCRSLDEIDTNGIEDLTQYLERLPDADTTSKPKSTKKKSRDLSSHSASSRCGSNHSRSSTKSSRSSSPKPRRRGHHLSRMKSDSNLGRSSSVGRGQKQRQPKSLIKPEKLAAWQIRQQQKHRVTPVGVSLYSRRLDDDDDDDDPDLPGAFRKTKPKKGKRPVKTAPPAGTIQISQEMRMQLRAARRGKRQNSILDDVNISQAKKQGDSAVPPAFRSIGNKQQSARF